VQLNRKEVGYSVYSRLEQGLRDWIRDYLLRRTDSWQDLVPQGVWNKAEERDSRICKANIEDPLEILEESDIPDLRDLICSRSNDPYLLPALGETKKALTDLFDELYDLRCRIAHVKRSFTSLHLDRLRDIATQLAGPLDAHGDDIRSVLKTLETAPASLAVSLPPDILVDGEEKTTYLHNLPPSDYAPDGGFIGRTQDLKKLGRLVRGDLDRVITVNGAGGVGKTALVHRFCHSLLQQADNPFSAIVWASAKEERLTLTGIEPIEPSIRNYGSVLNRILEVYGWRELLDRPLAEKEEYTRLILSDSDGGILLVVDNLETIEDERILQFIKDVPRPNKVLITSRKGLGEVERRHTLGGMSAGDAIALMRAVAREKGADSLAKLPDDTLEAYAERMSMYPLAIKWVVGQIALGRDIEGLLQQLVQTTSDVARFCFDHIFERCLTKQAKAVLSALASTDRAITRGVLDHVTELGSATLDDALQELTLASLVVIEQEKSAEGPVITRFSLLPLTWGYVKGRLQEDPELAREIQRRMDSITSLVEQSQDAEEEYRYNLRNIGAETEDQRIAAFWALTAVQRYHSGDYNTAITLFEKAVNIAPNLARIYRNWAVVESDEGYNERAGELLNRATSMEPEDASLWFVWGNVEKKRGEYENALRYYQRVLELSPKDGAVLAAMGDVEKRRKNFGEAERLLLEAHESAEYSSTARHRLVVLTSLSDNARRWSELLKRENKDDEALLKSRAAYDYAWQAAQLHERDEKALKALRQASLDYSLLLLPRVGIQKTLPYIKRAVVKSPGSYKDRRTNAIACDCIARSLLEIGEADQAQKWFELGSEVGAYTGVAVQRHTDLGLALDRPRDSGMVTVVRPERGFGFIEPAGKPGERVFFHVSSLAAEGDKSDLEALVGKRVQYTLFSARNKSAKHPEAKWIQVLKQEAE